MMRTAPEGDSVLSVETPTGRRLYIFILLTHVTQVIKFRGQKKFRGQHNIERIEATV
jgi:hypothetical protein